MFPNDNKCNFSVLITSKKNIINQQSSNTKLRQYTQKIMHAVQMYHTKTTTSIVSHQMQKPGMEPDWTCISKFLI